MYENMSTRHLSKEKRGLLLAKTGKVHPYKDHWRVESEDGNKVYTIRDSGRGPECTCKNYQVAQKNELLCKFIAFDIVVLIHEIYENGMEPILYKQEPRLDNQKNAPKNSYPAPKRHKPQPF